MASKELAAILAKRRQMDGSSEAHENRLESSFSSDKPIEMKNSTGTTLSIKDKRYLDL